MYKIQQCCCCHGTLAFTFQKTLACFGYTPRLLQLLGKDEKTRNRSPARACFGIRAATHLIWLCAHRHCSVFFLAELSPIKSCHLVELLANLRKKTSSPSITCLMRCPLGARPSFSRLSLRRGFVLVTAAFAPLNRPGGSYHSNRASSVFGTLTSSSPQHAYTQLLTNRAAHPVMVTAAAAASTAAAAAGSTTPAEKLGGYARLLRGEWSLDAASALDQLVPKLGGDKYKGQVRGSPAYRRYSCRLVMLYVPVGIL